MSPSKVQLPEGVRDIIGKKAYAKRRIEQHARECLLLCGYQEIETPTFEYACVFDSELGDLCMENMVHFFDADGRMLTMRPDFTLPCARLVSALHDSFPSPVRVFYIGNAFGLEHNTGRQRLEFSQAGAELMGLRGTAADAEIIMVANQVLEGMGLDSYILDIGHVGVYEALWKQAGLTRAQADALRALLDQKNEIEAKDFMIRLGMDQKLQIQFLYLIDLYGGLEVLEQAKRVLTAQGCRSVLDELDGVCRMLVDCGLRDRLTIDLGLLTNMDYYTGTVFRAMTDGVGSPLLSGGRYDNVLEQFGRPMPATGFAVGIQRVMDTLEKANKLEQMPSVSVSLGTTPDRIGQALSFAAMQRKQGQIVVVSEYTSKQELLQNWDRKGAQNAMWLDEDGAVTLFGREDGA